jgi:rhodanese-related sulfurtransferase
MAKTAVDLVTEARVGLENISPEDAQAEVASGKAVLLDIREPVEWSEHSAARRVIVYCRSGVRAALAASTLKTLGYVDVANLDGGLSAWKAGGLPIADHHEGL